MTDGEKAAMLLEEVFWKKVCDGVRRRAFNRWVKAELADRERIAHMINALDEVTIELTVMKNEQFGTSGGA